MSSLSNELDDYEFRYLVYHLAEANRGTELYSLLTLEEVDGTNAWFRARDSRGETAGYIDDLQRARKLADDAAARFRGKRRSAAMGQQCRYALMRAALNYVAESIDAHVSSRLVKAGVWTQEQALTYARLSSPQSRLKVIIGALALASGEQQAELAHEALVTAQLLAENVERSSDVITELVQGLPDAFLGGVLEVLGAITNESSRRDGLKALAPRLPPSLASGALTMARGIADPGERASVLAALAANLPAEEASRAFKEALAAARYAREPQAVLVELADRVPLALLPDLLSISRELPDGPFLEVSIAVVGRHAEKRPKWALEQLLTLGDDYVSRTYWKALDRTASALAYADFPWHALDAARAIPSAARPETLSKLAAIVPIQVRRAILEEVCQLGEYRPLEAMEALARNADEEFGQAVLDAASHMGTWRVQVLSTVAAALPEPSREQALRVAFEAAAAAEQDREALQMLAPFLPYALVLKGLELVTDPTKYKGWHHSDGQTVGCLAARLAELGEPRRALDIVLRLRDATKRADALGALAIKLPADLLGKVRDATEPPHYQAEWLAACTALSRYLPPAVLQRIFECACAMEDPVERIDGLVGLAPWLPEANRLLGMRTALAALPEIPYPNPRPMLEALDRILPHLPASLADSAIDAAMQIADVDARISALVRVARNFDGVAAFHAWRHALNDTSRLTSSGRREKSFIRLAPLVPSALHEDLLNMTGDLRKDARAEIFIRTASGLSPRLLDRAITEVRAMRRAARLPVLGQLLKYAEPSIRRDVVNAEYVKLEGNDDAEKKGWLFAAILELGPYDQSEVRAQRTESAFKWVLRRRNIANRAMMLAVLAGRGAGRVEHDVEGAALVGAASVTDDDLPPVLGALAVFLPPARLPEVVHFAEVRLSSLQGRDTDSAYRIVADAGDALGALALRASRAEQYETALKALQLISEIGRSEAIEPLIPLLPSNSLYQAATLTEDVNVLGQIAVQLGKSGAWQPSLLVIGDMVENYRHGSSSADKPGAPIAQIAQIVPARLLDELLRFALQLPEDQQARALPAILDRLARRKRRVVLEHAISSRNSELLLALTDHFSSLPARNIINAWTIALQQADQTSYPMILTQIQVLGPAIAAFSPDSAIAVYNGLEVVAKVQGQHSYLSMGPYDASNGGSSRVTFGIPVGPGDHQRQCAQPDPGDPPARSLDEQARQAVAPEALDAFDPGINPVAGDTGDGATRMLDQAKR
jgi:hypothetical protein